MKECFRNLARGTHCLSVGSLALGISLSGLIPTGQPVATPAPNPASPAAVTAAPAASTAPDAAQPGNPAKNATPAPAPTPETTPEPIPAEQTPAPAAAPVEKPAPVVNPAVEKAAEKPLPEKVYPLSAAPAAPAPAAAVVSAAAAAAPKAKASLMHFMDTHEIPPGPFGKMIFEVAARYSLNPHLVAAIVRVESSFNPRAKSRKGACGLMQLLPETARRFGLRSSKDLFDPAKNLEAGARYLKWLSSRFGGDPVRVLAAYNAGEGAVQRYGGVPPYKETRNYVTKIYALLGLMISEAPKAAPPAAETALAR